MRKKLIKTHIMILLSSAIMVYNQLNFCIIQGAMNAVTCNLYYALFKRSLAALPIEKTRRKKLGNWGRTSKPYSSTNLVRHYDLYNLTTILIYFLNEISHVFYHKGAVAIIRMAPLAVAFLKGPILVNAPRFV